MFKNFNLFLYYGGVLKVTLVVGRLVEAPLPATVLIGVYIVYEALVWPLNQ